MVDFSFQMGQWQAELLAAPGIPAGALRDLRIFMQPFLVEPGEGAGRRRLLILAACALEEGAGLPCPTGVEPARWQEYRAGLHTAYRRYLQAKLLTGHPPERPEDLFSYRGRDDKGGEIIALVFRQAEKITYARLWGFCFAEAARWQVENGGLVVHASAVLSGSSGFLFQGVSGRGKSTVARLSAASGLQPLGDDLNFIQPDPAEGGYLLQVCPSPSRLEAGCAVTLARPPLRAIFLLVQSRQDRLVPVGPARACQALFQAFHEQAPYVPRLAEDIIQEAFHVAARVARAVPAYELHFRKSPDFWHLIHEQFPE